MLNFGLHIKLQKILVLFRTLTFDNTVSLLYVYGGFTKFVKWVFYKGWLQCLKTSKGTYNLFCSKIAALAAHKISFPASAFKEKL